MKITLILSFLTAACLSFSQIIDPFSIRYQVNQKGGLVQLANTAVGCNCAANNEMPPAGTGDNNNFSMTFVDIDSDPTTYMSTSDQLNLPACSEVTWAGLYWTGILNNTPSTTPNWASRDQVKLSVDGGAYLNLTADELLDNTVGKVAYFAFKDITSIVQANGINSTYRVGNVVAKTGTNTFGGWTIVVVYNNIYQSMRNLTVFDGLANVSPGAAGTVNIGISGFLTPPSGAVNFELGVVAHDGDRGQSGDQLEFNGTGTFVNVSDALHPLNNVFNSTISNNGVLTPLRNPSYNNNLGHDANIYVPNNTTFNYIGNSATSASIRVSTQSETVLTSVISSAIDIYEPDLRASVSYLDMNGGTVTPGDILEYTIVAKNIGSDVSIGTFLTDTLDDRLTYLPGTMAITYGPNTGPKTDPIDADQAEFLPATNVIRARIGTGANGTTGGAVINSPTGADSTVIKFQVQLTNDCAVWQCGPILENKAFLFGTGQISGITNGNNGASDQLDINGCPSFESGIVNVDVSACPDTVITHPDSLCVGEDLWLNFPNSSFLTFSWTGPNGFTSTSNNPTIPNSQLVNGGDYILSVTYNGVQCIADSIATIFISDNPTLQLNAIQNDSCFNLGVGFINVSGVGNDPFTYTWSNGDADSLANGLNAGTYSVIATDQYGCEVADTFSITEPPQLNALATITSNYNGQDISCYGAMDGSANVVASGGILPYTYLWTPGLQTTTTISGLDAGTHVITVTDSNGCEALDSVTLIQPDSLNISAIVTNVLCFGDTTGAINVSVTGGTTPYTYSWSNSVILEDLINLGVGSYTDTVTDINGCIDTATFVITQPTAPLSMTDSITEILCFGDLTGSIELTVTGGVGPYIYSWSNGDNDSLAGNLGAGTYIVSVLDQNNCEIIDTFTLNQPTVLTATAAITSDYNGQDISCFNAMDGSADVTVTGGVLPYSYSWTPGLQITDSIFNLDAGTHVITVTDSNGCIAMDSVTLVQPDTISIVAVVTNILCYSDTTGAINATVSGGTAPYLYSWSNGITLEDLINLGAGTYTDTVTDVNGCMNIASFVVNQPVDSMTITATSTDILCFGDSTANIDLTVSGGNPPYTYSWSNGSITEDLTGLPAGNYTVTVTDSNNCSQSFVVVIDQPTPIVLSETHLNPLCQNGTQGSIDLTVSGGTPGYSYSWNNGEFTQDISGLYAGLYFVTVVDTNGCVDTLSIALTDPDAVLISASLTEVLCYSDSTGAIDISLTNGTPGFVYDWSNGATTQDLTNIPSGPYYVNVVDTNGCGGFMSFVIDQPDTSLYIASNSIVDLLCYNDSIGEIDIEVAGGVAPYSYLWSGGEITQDLQNLGQGIYSVVVTDANMCQVSFVDTIFQPAELVLTETHVNILCFGDSTGSIDITTIGGVQPYAYLWNTGAITEDLTGIPLGSYSLTVTDTNNCVDTISIVITQPAAPLNLTSSQIAVLCFGDSSGSIDLTVTGGTPGYAYNWNTGDTLQDLDSLLAGTYTVLVTDTNGCLDSLSAIIIEPSAPLSISAIETPTCFGDSIGALDITVSGGTAPYTYSWNNGAITQDLQDLAPGIYTLTVTDGNLCEITFTDTILQPTEIVLTETHVDVLCYGAATGSINLNVTGGIQPYSYDWSNGSLTQDLVNITAGTYSVVVSDDNNCTDTLSATITQPLSPIDIQTVIVPVLCYGGNNGSIEATVSGGTPGYQFSWNTGDTVLIIDTLTAGTYTLTVTDTNGCISTLPVVVPQPFDPISLTTYSSPICFGDSSGFATVNATGGTPGYTYLWNNGGTDTIITNLPVGTYSVVVMDANGCTNSISVDVTVQNEAAGCVVITMPNVFTPNGDGANEFFIPIEILSIREYNLLIVNRWGNVVFETIDYTQGWDGTTPNGNEVNEGVYFWKITYTDVYNKSGELHGNVTLIRD